MTAPPLFAADLQTLATWLAGTFENQAQALHRPAQFVRLRLWHRPIPTPLAIALGGQVGFFIEQANVLQLDRAYRQRLLILQAPSQSAAMPITGRYWGFQDPVAYRGSGQDPSPLETLERRDLQDLPGCELTITYDPVSQRYQGVMPPTAVCTFTYQEAIRQVVLGLEVSETEFWSADRGVDPTTGRSLWGALAGPYHFVKDQKPMSPDF